ncbi:hypothetical protein [Comamonas thiooxydans]|uniref:hypothetical protein n=1 Tax=Comamonas thiooxydans TaxID=363952 RepID=UPI00209C6206|nr:hypothetical protein [Comamonas thiooxydans]MCO8252164.1 hypothetical protein [Comamonas thiooxydans]
MISTLHSGDRLTLPGKPESYWEVISGVIHAGSVEIFDSEKRTARYVDESKIRAGISAGTLILQRKGMPRVGIAVQYDNPALHARVRQLQEALRYIDAIQKQLELSFGAAMSIACKDYAREHANDPLASEFPSRATLYRAHKNQSLGLPVLKGDKNKGNSTPRYSNALVDFILSVIRDRYLVTESTWTVFDLTGYINREARRRGLHDAKHAISRKFVISAIQRLTSDAEYDRMDPLNRVAGKSFAKKRIRAAFPLSRIEQDAVHLPFVVQTPHGVARTVYLVLAIDVCTGYPMGWRLVIGAPRDMDSLLCLEMYLTPAKAARFKELGVAHDLNIYGTPSQVIFDNGPETKGGRIMGLEMLGMDVKHCRAKEAQGKPFIERLNRSLKEALQCLPGCTRFNGNESHRVWWRLVC